MSFLSSRTLRLLSFSSFAEPLFVSFTKGTQGLAKLKIGSKEEEYEEDDAGERAADLFCSFFASPCCLRMSCWLPLTLLRLFLFSSYCCFCSFCSFTDSSSTPICFFILSIFSLNCFIRFLCS